eukprot:TRINITY_DN10572_c0_g1_i1.p1 TRINITY_DN10572_c0_g1~~TRINITY_DN10572_c0_g1_i1.p1  ORF type:complete len:301 (+),score=124.02 TRINITY_DN10572_c0_g1_i1:20-922(+)
MSNALERRATRAVMKQADREENKSCIHCEKPSALLICEVGCFVCPSCATVHTNNGHTSKSYDSDNFSAEESALVKEMDGNLNIAKVFLEHYEGTASADLSEDDREALIVEAFVKKAYKTADAEDTHEEEKEEEKEEDVGKKEEEEKEEDKKEEEEKEEEGGEREEENKEAKDEESDDAEKALLEEAKSLDLGQPEEEVKDEKVEEKEAKKEEEKVEEKEEGKGEEETKEEKQEETGAEEKTEESSSRPAVRNHIPTPGDNLWDLWVADMPVDLRESVEEVVEFDKALAVWFEDVQTHIKV